MKTRSSPQNLIKAGNLSVILLFASLSLLKAQLTPSQDPSWGDGLGNQVPAIADEFNSLSFSNIWDLPTNSFMNAQPVSAANTILSGQSLHLKFTANNTSNGGQINSSTNTGAFGTDYPGYWTAMVNDLNGYWRTGALTTNTSQKPALSYGFYEIRAKMPGYPDQTNPSLLTQEGLVPGWMIYRLKWCNDPNYPGINNCIHDEIDCNEGDGWTNRNFRINSHFFRGTGCSSNGDCIQEVGNHQTLLPEVDVVNTWHKYGVEVMPDRVILYFDDQPFAWMLNTGLVATTPGPPLGPYLTVSFGLSMSNPGYQAKLIPMNPYPYPNGLLQASAPVTPIPAQSNIEMVLDYFRYYKLNAASCTIDYLINSTSDITTLPNEIRQNIQVGQISTQAILMSPNSTKVLRHSADFDIVCDFEVQNGSELTIIATPCQ